MIVLILSGLLMYIAPSGDAAAPAVPIRNNPIATGEVAWPNYCGLYSVYAAARLFDRPVTFASLARPEFCGGKFGSTLEELAAAVESCGLVATPVKNLSTEHLRYIAAPIVLHVRATAGSPTYNHYVLYLYAENGRAKIVDELRESTVDLRELAGRWDGIGLIISEKPISVAGALTPRDWGIGIVVAVLCGASIIFRFRSTARLETSIAERISSTKLKRVGVQVTCIVLVATAAAVFINSVSARGLLAGGPLVAQITDRQLTKFLNRVDMASMKRIIGDGTATVLDARSASDFNFGHIPSARNLPPCYGVTEVQTSLQDVPKDRRLVVYCQSRGCPYSDDLARILIAIGYSRVEIYRNGWEEWNRENSR